MVSESFEANIESLSPEGRGVAHVDGKVVFIDGALTGERVRYKRVRKRGRYDEGTIVEVVEASPQRVTPQCPHTDLCGGCALQHFDADAQILHKQQVLLDQLQHVAGLAPIELLAPLRGPVWGYRNKARLAVKYVAKKGGALVGFREKRKPYVADIQGCEVLHPAVGAKLLQLRALVNDLSGSNRIPQIEVAIGDQSVALVVRHLTALTDADLQALVDFSADEDVDIYLQPGGPETVEPLGEVRRLSYDLSGHEIEIDFFPTDFTQVNPTLNRAMVDLVVELLSPGPDTKVLDLFCGLGNFTLPLAKRAGAVLGLEGSQVLVQRAAENAARNNISNAEFLCTDLSVPGGAYMRTSYDLVLLDPPRTGAREILEAMSLASTHRVVYVSCNSSTFSRDAAILTEQHGFRLFRAGVIDMFPHTSHVESVALFERL